MRFLTAFKGILNLQVTTVTLAILANVQIYFVLWNWQRQEQAVMLMFLHSFGLNHIVGGVADNNAVDDDSAILGRAIQSTDALVILGISPEPFLNHTSH